jgi:alpha-tubulin suppressor-like RCC1 family protein
MAKGKDFGIKKEQKGKKVKDFEELKFRFNDRDMLVTIVSISAGEEHVMALDIEKNVWGFGSNKNKQINPLADEHFYKNFVRLDYLKHVNSKIL